MSGITITAKNTSIINVANKVNLPVMDGLAGAYFMGSLPSNRNFASLGPALKVNGSPTNATEYSSIFPQDVYFDTGIPFSGKITLITVAKKAKQVSDGVYRPFIGSWLAKYNSLTTFGCGIVGVNDTVQGVAGVITAGQATAASSRNSSIGETGLPADSTAPWRLMSQRISSTSNIVSDMTKGLSNTSTLNAGESWDTRSANNILIAAGNGTNYAANTEIMLALVFTRALTDTEMSLITTWCKNFAQRRGVTV